MPSLFVIRGADQGARFQFDEPLVRIGRDSIADIQLHDTEISRQHAEIQLIGGEYLLVDVGSSNGTFVNGRRVDRHMLVSGDQVQLGRSLMLYTGPVTAAEDLSRSVAISAGPEGAGGSRIVRSLAGQDGPRLDYDFGKGVEDSDAWANQVQSHLRIIYRTALAVSQTVEIDQLLSRLVDMIFEWVEADRACIMLMDQDTQQLKPQVRRMRSTTEKGRAPGDEQIRISKTILDYVLEKNEGVLTSDAVEDDRWTPAASILQSDVREAICVPMRGRYGVVGVIYIDTARSAEEVLRSGPGSTKFQEEHLKLMVAIAYQAALAIEDTHYYSAMVQAERLAAIGQTVASLSHHIKNILQGIRGGSYLIEMGINEDNADTTRKGWSIVERNQNKISALVMDMLTFSKERQPEPQESRLNEVVADVVELMQSRANEMGVELNWQADTQIGTTVFDAEAMHRAILNIVTNAIDAAAEREDRGGRVEIQTHLLEDGHWLSVEVFDNGPGIPEDQLDKLFSPFVSSKGSRGTGLGLPVSQKILAEHGGRIEVESSPKAGSLFRLILPSVL